MFDLISHISDLRLSALCLCASAPLHLTKLSSFVIVFMQNKPNFQKSQMNANLYNTSDYERKRDWTLGESKPNSNPIKPNFKLRAYPNNRLVMRPSPDISGRPRRQAKNARQAWFFLHVENIFARQRRHRALQPDCLILWAKQRAGK